MKLSSSNGNVVSACSIGARANCMKQIYFNSIISTSLSLSQFCLENKRDYTFHLTNLVSIIGCNCKTDWKRIVQCTAMITLNFRLELDRERAKCNWTFFQTQIVHLTLLPVLPCILAAIQRLTVTSEPNIVDRINRLFHISSIPFSWTHTSKSTLAYIHTLSNESSWFIERFEPSVHALLVQTHTHIHRTIAHRWMCVVNTFGNACQCASE